MSSIFDSLDTDGDGTLDAVELYSGVLLIHLELAKYFGPAACKPPSRGQVDSMFRTFDSDNSGDLDKAEFCALSTLLLSNIAGRVLFQFLMTIALLPLLAPKIVARAAEAFGRLEAADPWGKVSLLKDLWSSHVLDSPTVGPYAAKLLFLVPSTLPKTVVSVTVVTLVVPSVLDYIDMAVMKLVRRAERRKKKRKSE